MSAHTNGRRLAVLVTCVVLLAGCGGSDDDGDPKTTTQAATTTTAPPAARALPADYYEDPDGDLVPTAVEKIVGTDPEAETCSEEAGCDGAGAANALEQSNTLLILDSSGSMAGSAGGGVSKIVAARRALRRFVAGTPDSVALGFMVYGHKGSNDAGGKAASCAGIELLRPIGTAASKGFARMLSRFRPRGYTPLGGALRRARAAFAGKGDGVNRIILVTDGVETCDGDPVAEARRLRRAAINVTTDVVGFDVADPGEARRLRAIAEAAGGTYTDARTADRLDDYLDRQRRRYYDLVRTYLCVSASLTRITLCQGKSITKAYLAMNKLAVQASDAGDEAAADEINRLQALMDEAGRKRDADFDRRSDETEAALQREIDEADRRLLALEGSG